MMTYGTETILIGCWIAMAWWQSRLIKANRPIYHGWWAAIAVTLILLANWWAYGWPPTEDREWLYLGAQGCSRIFAFNIALNRFRGLSWTYVSKTSTSIIDQAELRLFGGRTWVVEILAAICFIILQFFI